MEDNLKRSAVAYLLALEEYRQARDARATLDAFESALLSPGPVAAVRGIARMGLLGVARTIRAVNIAAMRRALDAIPETVTRETVTTEDAPETVYPTSWYTTTGDGWIN